MMDDMPIGQLGLLVRYLEDGGCLALMTAGKHLWGGADQLACGCRHCVCDACYAVLVTHWCRQHAKEEPRRWLSD